MDYLFVLWFLVFFINLIFIFKPIPIFSVPLCVMSVFFAGETFLTDNNFFIGGVSNGIGFFMVMFILFIAVIQLYVNIHFLRGKK
jgi:hypothetical protein